MNRQLYIKVRLLEIAREFGVSFMAALITGILFGLLLRLAMKIIAIFFPFLATGFTVEGTLIIIFVGIAGTLAFSIVFTLIFQNSTKGWGSKGLLYGGGIFLVYGIPLFLSNTNLELFGPQAPLGIVLFGLLIIIGPVILSFFIDRISYWVNQLNSRRKFAYISFIIFSIPATIMLVNIIAEFFYEILPEAINQISRL